MQNTIKGEIMNDRHLKKRPLEPGDPPPLMAWEVGRAAPPPGVELRHDDVLPRPTMPPSFLEDEALMETWDSIVAGAPHLNSSHSVALASLCRAIQLEEKAYAELAGLTVPGQREEKRSPIVMTLNAVQRNILDACTRLGLTVPKRTAADSKAERPTLDPYDNPFMPNNRWSGR